MLGNLTAANAWVAPFFSTTAAINSLEGLLGPGPSRTVLRCSQGCARRSIDQSNDQTQLPVSVGTDGRDRVTAFDRGAPRLGEHTREVLAAAGLSNAEIDRLASAEAI